MKDLKAISIRIDVGTRRIAEGYMGQAARLSDAVLALTVAELIDQLIALNRRDNADYRRITIEADFE